MTQNPKVLVVGTTSDYIDYLRSACPGQAVFLTDPSVRQAAYEPAPTEDEEIIWPLADYEGAARALGDHLRCWDIALDGVACFDCESMELAAILAEENSLDYPSRQTILNCRDKYRTKLIWQQAGLNTPAGQLVDSPADVIDFFDRHAASCLLKPTTGSGSELIFYCTSRDGCENYFRALERGLRERASERLYSSPSFAESRILVEQFIAGDEFSADVLIDGDRVQVIRVARKFPKLFRYTDEQSDQCVPGTTRAYLVPAPLPQVEQTYFCEIMRRGAHALGIERAITMVDFIMHEGEMVLLELAPRPGGDLLPQLLREFGIDILTFTLDFAAGRPAEIGLEDNVPRIGLRLHAEQRGVLRNIDVSRASGDPRVRQIGLLRKRGDLIELPPSDYNSWILGQIIFEPNLMDDVQEACDQISALIDVEIV